jgi:hypothetical protein
MTVEIIPMVISDFFILIFLYMCVLLCFFLGTPCNMQLGYQEDYMLFLLHISMPSTYRLSLDALSRSYLSVFFNPFLLFVFHHINILFVTWKTWSSISLAKRMCWSA